MARPVAIVPHIHWDREWYAPFQAFRLRLVDTLDELLPRLEADPSYARFLLDGQMAIVDDYLAVRPEAGAGLERLALAGRIDIGPWYTLMDEFLVSGETLVRDLQLGIERAARFGGAMDVGYLPDMFGHVAQMPQLLWLADIHHAVVWRGVPRAIERDAFWWRAPDGTGVRAEYLLSGYGAEIPEDPAVLVARVAAFEEELGPFLAGEILLMSGGDHKAPPPWLGRVVAEANALQHDYQLRVTSLPEYLVSAPTRGLPSWQGELRSGARANLLMGVASNRVDVKQAAARAERALERKAEPLSALFLSAERWPAALLAKAWRKVIRNAAHDSVCACSADEVCQAVLQRYAEARQIGDGLTERALGVLGASLADEGWVAVNASARTRGGVVEFEVPGSGPLPGAQVVEDRGPILMDRVLTAEEATGLLRHVRSQQLDEQTFVNEVDVEETEAGLTVRVEAHRELRTHLLIPTLVTGVLARLRSRPGARLRLVVRREPTRRILVRVPPVPGFGWRLVGDVVPPDPPVAAGPLRLANGVATVEVDPATGTFSLNGRAGLDRLVDGGDAGDTYTYSPPERDRVVGSPDAVSVEVIEAGPVRGRLQVTRLYRWPERVEGGRRVGEREVRVATDLELRAGEPAVRVTTSFDNPCRDHRLRAHFPLPEASSVSRAECAFAVVERGLEAEGGPHERALATFPSRRFVSAGGLTLVHEGLQEYELIEGGRVLALTLLRATGMLSRVEVAYRPLPAGPPMELAGPQLLGHRQLRYAVCADPGVDPYALADDILLPLDVATAPGGGVRAPSGSSLAVRGAETSALRRVAAGLELRLFNPSPVPATVTVEGRRGWVVDLRGAPQERFEETTTLRPWGILTLLLPDGED